mgnify:CR=1 FL=1
MSLINSFVDETSPDSMTADCLVRIDSIKRLATGCETSARLAPTTSLQVMRLPYPVGFSGVRYRSSFPHRSRSFRKSSRSGASSIAF